MCTFKGFLPKEDEDDDHDHVLIIITYRYNLDYMFGDRELHSCVVCMCVSINEGELAKCYTCVYSDTLPLYNTLALLCVCM